MAVITLAASAALWGAVLYAYSGRTWRYMRFIAYGLPLSALVNLLVKAPLAEGAGGLFGIDPGQGLGTPAWFLVFLFMLAPVFEELVKVAPALLPPVRRASAGPDDAYWIGLALGIGFGLGEAVYLAWQVAASGLYEQYPWYAFTGFFGERLLVVFVHGLMTAFFLWLAARRRPLAGFGLAMGMHALVNSGAMLYQLELVPIWVGSATLLLVLVGGVLLFEKTRPRAAFGAGRQETVHFSREG